jgi:putative oxidoreductase
MTTETSAATRVPAAPADVPAAVTTIVPALGRVLISMIFILSAVSKLAAPAAVIGYIQSVGLPLPQAVFGLAVLIEIAGGVALLIGFHTRIAAGVLAVFALVTAAIFHNNFADQNQFLHFFKNVAMAGGLLHVVAFGGGRISVDGRRV